MASGFLSLEGIRGASEELSRVARALAQEHAVALIVGSDGGLSFSPSVARAISEAHLPHPLQKTIARACEAHRARTGSDCTQLLTLLGEALRLAARLAGELGDARARSALLAELPLLEAALPDLFREVRVATASPADPALFGERLAEVVRSRSEAASGIVCEFVRRISVVPPDWSAASLTEALDYFVDRFEDVCSRAVTPAVDDSSVLEGFLLMMSSDYCPPRSAVRFVVVWDVSVKTDDVIWTGVSTSKIWSRIEAALSGLVDRGVSAILTPSAAPSRLRSCCSRLGIALVDRLSPGELRNISFFTGVVPLDTLSDSLEEADCVLHVDSARPVVFGSSRFLHLQTSSASARRPFRPCHVVLCAPSPAVWKERYHEFLDCLKVLRQWLMRPPGFVQDLSPNPVCGLSFPVGSWELELKLALPKKVGRSCPNACRVLDGALLAAACDAWGVPACRFRDGYREFAARAKGVVPAATAESVVFEVLQLLRQLLRIDAVLGSKEAIRSFVANR